MTLSVLILVVVQYGGDGFLVCSHYGVYVFRSACPTLYLEHSDSCIHESVDEADGLQILRAHKVLVVYFYLVACLSVGEDVRASTYLYAFATVGRATAVGKAHITLA